MRMPETVSLRNIVAIFDYLGLMAGYAAVQRFRSLTPYYYGSNCQPDLLFPLEIVLYTLQTRIHADVS
jgi:hypothetical protein